MKGTVKIPKNEVVYIAIIYFLLASFFAIVAYELGYSEGVKSIFKYLQPADKAETSGGQSDSQGFEVSSPFAFSPPGAANSRAVAA